MKKAFLLLLLAVLCSNNFVRAEVSDTETVANDDNKPAYTFYKNYSHWSIAASGGFNLLLCERVVSPSDGKLANYKNNFLGQFNAEVEYSINPCWGFALNYAYAPISRRAIFVDKASYDVNPESNGQGHQIYVMLNVNMLNLFQRNRSHSDWGWYFGAGGGVFLFNTSKAMYNPMDGQTLPWNATAMIPLETRLEFSPVNSLSIFLKAGLGMYLIDCVNIYEHGTIGDWNLYGGVGLRWNIGASKKESVRTIDMNTYEGGTGRRPRPAKDDDDDDNQKKVVENPATEQQLAELQRQIDMLQAQIANMQATPSAAVATSTTASAPDYSRLNSVEKLAQNNEADIKGLRSDINDLRKLAMASNGTDEYSVYFENGSSLITKEYELVIARVAKLMMLEPSLIIEISSFCSNTGNVEANKLLGEQRIDAVRVVLVNRYRIDANRVRAQYKGQIDDQFENVNRRCDLTFK